MTRRKRASLKDKGPEALGLTQKKGKGIDVLFGGPAGETVSNASATSDIEQPPVEETGTTEFEAADSEPEVDELGLPVAMEAPPEDLEFAAPGDVPPGTEAEKDAFDPALSPFTPSAPVSTSPVDDDLSGLMADDDLSGLESETDPASPPAADTADSSLPPVAMTPAEEVSSEETVADDLSGLEADLSEPVPPPPQPTAIPPTPPPATPDPFTGTPPPPSVDQPTTAPPSSVPSPPPPASPGTTSQPSPGAAPSPGPSSLSLPHSRVESLGGIVTERAVSSEKDILPPDIGPRDVDNIIAIREREQVEEDEDLAGRVIRYIGRERRESLDQKIEELYVQVESELNVNKEDAAFALKTLSEAQDIIFEDVRQYDEALYRVAVVRTMLARQRNFRRWSYTWGLAVFFYGLIWLGTFIAGFLFSGTIAALLETATPTTEGVRAVQAAWFSALAGGIGGIVNIFWGLYDHISRKQDFDRQYVMYYLVQPILGFILGGVAYFIVQAGFLVINFSAEVQSSDVVTAVAMIVGFIAGFRQRVVFEMIERIVKKILPKGEEEPDAGPVSSVPIEDRRRLRPPTG